jgi:predicted Zn-dependent peptidase
MDFQQFELSNGIKVILNEEKNADVSHCGLFINVGSRHENDDELGLAHFIEHCIFKGTTKRKAYHILNRMETVGGEINAYTTKEETCIYTSFLATHYERAIELIADISLNSTFPEKEIEKEKEVVLDEINSYLEDPYELIFDEFEEKIFNNHPVGRPILGSKKLIKKFKKEQLVNFVNKHYTTDNLFFSFSGNISAKKLKYTLEKHFSNVSNTSTIVKPVIEPNYSKFTISDKKKNYQTHAVIGTPAYSASHENRRGLILLNNILGGPGMNSRLNMEVREKHGLAYNIESSFNSYSDTGLFSIYFGSDKKNADKTFSLIQKELKKLKEIPLGVNQLHQAKQQLIGQIALGQESKVSIMLAIGKTLMVYNKVDDLSDIFKKIESITAQSLQEIANELFDENKLSTLTYIAK